MKMSRRFDPRGRKVTKRPFVLKAPVVVDHSLRRTDENTPESSPRKPTEPETPLPQDVSVSFLASTPKPGRPQLSPRRPFSAVQEEDGYQASLSSQSSNASRQSQRSKKSSSELSYNRSPPKKPRLSPRKPRLSPGGTLQNKIDAISKMRLEKVRMRRLSSGTNASTTNSGVNKSKANTTEAVDSSDLENEKREIGSKKTRSNKSQIRSSKVKAGITKLTKKTVPAIVVSKESQSSAVVQEEDDDDFTVDSCTVRLWQPDGVKRSRNDLLNLDVVHNMVTDTLHSLMQRCETVEEKSAVKTLNKYMVEDITKLIKKGQSCLTMQRAVTQSRQHIKQLKKKLMHVQKDRMRLESEVQPKQKQLKKNEKLEEINKFLTELKSAVDEAKQSKNKTDGTVLD